MTRSQLTPVTYEAGSRFLPEDADRLQSVLAAARGAEVEVDLRGVREWHPAALPRLAQLLSGAHRVRLRGLTDPLATLMRYLGARSSALAQPSAVPDLP